MKRLYLLLLIAVSSTAFAQNASLREGVYTNTQLPGMHYFVYPDTNYSSQQGYFSQSGSYVFANRIVGGDPIWIAAGQIWGNQINTNLVYVSPEFLGLPFFNDRPVFTIINTQKFSTNGLTFDWSQAIPSNQSSNIDTRPTITIVNETGYTILYVYISSITSDSWGNDMLDSNQSLRNGESVSIRLTQPLSVINRYDIKIVDSDNDSYVKANLPITNNATITFTIYDFVGQ